MHPSRNEGRGLPGFTWVPSGLALGHALASWGGLASAPGRRALRDARLVGGDGWLRGAGDRPQCPGRGVGKVFEIVLERLAMKLKALRKERGWKQPDLAKKSGLSPGYIARLETGRHDPKLSTLVKLAKALGVPVTELWA